MFLTGGGGGVCVMKNLFQSRAVINLGTQRKENCLFCNRHISKQYSVLAKVETFTFKRILQTCEKSYLYWLAVPSRCLDGCPKEI